MQRNGHVMTVTGAIDPLALGPTLMHEHVFVDLSAWHAMPDEPELLQLVDSEMSVGDVEAIRSRPLGSSKDNLVLQDEDLAGRELAAFTAQGGKALVDCTVIGIGRDPQRLRRVSNTTGLQIVLGTGIYVERAHPAWVGTASIDDLTALFTADVLDGIGDSGVRAGIIGEIGTSGIAAGQWQKHGAITAEEEKVLRAAGRASIATGAAVCVHLDPNTLGAFQVIDTLSEEGVAVDRMVMCHMDAVPDLEYHLAVASLGAYVEFDHFGRHYSTKNAEGRYTTDAERLRFLGALVEAGHEDRLLLSQDICMKIDLTAFGGVGYGHVLGLREGFNAAGITDEQLASLLVDNPRRVLTIAAPDRPSADRGTSGARSREGQR